MGDDSIGIAPPGNNDSTSGKDKICIYCQKVFQAPGPGNHKYCSAECKKASKTNKSSLTPSHQKHNNKRDNTVLSPQDTQSKLLKEDNFAFFFHDAFGCDIDTFIDLDKDDILSKFQSFFYTISEEMETLRLENKRLSSDSNLLNQELSDECNSLKQKLVVAKLALADKDIQLFEISSKNKQAAIVSVSQQVPAPTAEPIKKLPKTQKPIDNRPTLVARLRKGIPKKEVTDDRIDSLLGLNTDGPVVQQMKKLDDKITLTFRDITARDKARELINQEGQQSQNSLFQSAFVPQKVYPAIARLNGLAGVQGIKEENIQDEQLKKRVAIMKLIHEENPLLRSDLESVRVWLTVPKPALS